MKKYELKNNKALGRYEFDLGGATAAVDYEECGPGCIAVTHTGVPDRFCGQGIASQLTLAVLEDLKRQGLSVSAIARKLGMDRKTVRKHLEAAFHAAGLPVPVPRIDR